MTTDRALELLQQTKLIKDELTSAALDYPYSGGDEISHRLANTCWVELLGDLAKVEFCLSELRRLQVFQA